MGSQRRDLRRTAPRTITCGVADCAPRPAAAPAEGDAPARVIELAAGIKWLVTLVARLSSQDLDSGMSSTRLILRFESLSDPMRQPRIHAVTAESLDEMEEGLLRTLVARPTPKARRTAILRGRREAESGDR